jgi:hypothetical protein
VSRIAFSLRIIFALALALTLSACGPTIGNTFSTINNSLPGNEFPAVEEPPVEEALPTQDAQNEVVVPPALTAQPAIPEQRRLTLEFPPQIRVGDSDRVRLTLEVDNLGNLTPTAEVGGNVITGEVIEIPNLYETHNVIAEARFDITGLEVSPPDLVGQPFGQGQSVSFYWSILPERVGEYRGTIWLYLRFVERVSGEETQRVVSAQPVEIEAVNFLGLSGDLARSFGVVGSIAGTVVGFPFFEDIVRLLFRRRKRRR